jgi:succinate dehydrogenase flavin-adding protein (antitoxin of CptAB toxin-antitoxin module)
MSDSLHIRKLKHRLQRQGTLELQLWLAPLIQALESHDENVIGLVEQILIWEVPELIAMQTGQKPIPKELQPWLDI